MVAAKTPAVNYPPQLTPESFQAMLEVAAELIYTVDSTDQQNCPELHSVNGSSCFKGMYEIKPRGGL
jgi:hypothetical protein